MSSGPDEVTSTTRTEIPGYLERPLQTAATQAERSFLDAQFSGDPNLSTQSRGLVSDTLSGNYLSPDSNPYLQQTFNRAADLTRTRLDSEFSGAGRNIGAAAPARSQELQTLASNIYGQNYQTERDRQMSALAPAQDFDQVNQFINRLAAIIPNAGGITASTQPVFRQGLF